jgi:serine phosphatase RsbU (regulator of sigma subunit)
MSMGLRMRLSPVDVLQTANVHFYDAYTRTDLMATAAVIALNPETGVLEIANAGHPPILLRQGGSWQRLVATAPPLGVLPELDAEIQRATLQSGDLVVCYSDGFSEIQTPSRLWGQTGLLNAIPSDTKSENVQSLIQHIVEASQKAGRIEDDQTLITVKFTGE